MFSEEDGDSLVGRTVAQLKLDPDEFDVLPCHFGTSTLKELHEYGWDNILEGYSEYELSFKRTIPNLFASLVYHYHNGDLARIYPFDHPIFAQLILTDRRLIDSLKDKVILYFSYCPDTHMSAQGIPGFITISREIRQFKDYFTEKSRRTDEQFGTLTSRMKELHDSLPERIINLLLEKVKIDGIQQLSLDDIDIRKLISEVMIYFFIIYIYICYILIYYTVIIFNL